jgi:hypothetical protein
MKVLVICRPRAGGDAAAFARLVPDETVELRRLRDNGTLTEAWSPGRPGAVLMLEVAGLGEAEAAAAGLPLAGAGLITVEIIPLLPLPLPG